MRIDLKRKMVIALEISMFFYSGIFFSKGIYLDSILFLILGLIVGIWASNLIIDNALQLKGGSKNGLEKESS